MRQSLQWHVLPSYLPSWSLSSFGFIPLRLQSVSTLSYLLPDSRITVMFASDTQSTAEHPLPLWLTVSRPPLRSRPNGRKPCPSDPDYFTSTHMFSIIQYIGRLALHLLRPGVLLALDRSGANSWELHGGKGEDGGFDNDAFAIEPETRTPIVLQIDPPPYRAAFVAPGVDDSLMLSLARHPISSVPRRMGRGLRRCRRANRARAVHNIQGRLSGTYATGKFDCRVRITIAADQELRGRTA